MDLIKSLILTRVEYALLGSGAAWLDDNSTLPFHEIDREVRLIDHVGRNSFMSWVDYGDINEVAVHDGSFFRSPPPVVRDMSRSTLWEDLIGQEVELFPIRTLTKGLVIRSASHQLCCCCYEQGSWGVDVLHISRDFPTPITT